MSKDYKVSEFARQFERLGYTTLKLRRSQGDWFGLLVGGPQVLQEIEFGSTDISGVFSQLCARIFAEDPQGRPLVTTKKN